jgi:hypothetical protein
MWSRTELEKQGAIVDEAIAYRTVAETEDSQPARASASASEEGADVITFTSASTVEHFFNLGSAHCPKGTLFAVDRSRSPPPPCANAVTNPTSRPKTTTSPVSSKPSAGTFFEAEPPARARLANVQAASDASR